MALDHATRVVLTDDQLQGLLDVIGTSATPVVDCLLALWPMIVGDDVWAVMGPGDLTPWDWAIPERQWQRLGEAVTVRERELFGALTAVNGLLDMMNKGPSAFKEPVDA